MSTPPAEELRRELDELSARHRDEMRALTERHLAAIEQLRSSLSYRIGAMVVGLRSRQGWRRLPSTVRSIVRDARSRPRRTGARMAAWGDVTPRDQRPVWSILDEFTHACLSPELRLQPLTASGSSAGSPPMLLLAETAWRGNDGAWSYAFSQFDPNGPLATRLRELEASGVPSAIWNKEDPAGYETFLPAVAEFDHVFTTDAGSVDRYRRDLGHDRVTTCMFAAQPALHNPIGRAPDPTACFAGAWRGHRYPERGKQLAELLDAAASATEVVIFDREPVGMTPEQTFPSRYHDLIRGTLPYDRMVAEYRKHACFLNVNSVTDSPTMLSRRVFEILACRTPVVSTPSRAIDEHFAEIVQTPSGRDEIADVVGRLVDDIDHRDRIGQLGYRTVMTDHTYQHRVADMLATMGIAGFDPPAAPTIDIICVSQRPEYLDRVVSNVRAQRYPNARLVFVTNHDGFDPTVVERALSDLPGASALHLPASMTLGECLNAAVERSEADYFAKFDDDDVYGEHFLSDMVLATRFAQASVYGKQTFHAYVESADRTVVRHEGSEFAYVNLVMGGTLLVRRADVIGIPFRALPRGTDTQFLNECTASGLSIFSTDRFGYLMTRRGPSAGHTWQIGDEEFLRASRTIGSGCRVDDVLI